jgi:hypothetical protein
MQNDLADDVRWMLTWHSMTWLNADVDTLYAKKIGLNEWLVVSLVYIVR